MKPTTDQVKVSRLSFRRSHHPLTDWTALIFGNFATVTANGGGFDS